MKVLAFFNGFLDHDVDMFVMQDIRSSGKDSNQSTNLFFIDESFSENLVIDSYSSNHCVLPWFRFYSESTL